MTTAGFIGPLGWPELIILAFMGFGGLMVLAVVVLVLALLLRKSSTAENHPPADQQTK